MDNDPPKLCPLDSQRSLRVLLVKFFVVNFTTLSFYLHFHYQREGIYLSVDSFIFFIAPLNVVFRYVVGMIGIASYGCFHLLYSYFTQDLIAHRQRTSTQITRALGTLFGKDPGALGYTLPHPIPSSDDDHPKPTTTDLSPIERAARLLGSLLTTGAFLAQCCGAIYLYSRRQQHDAVIAIDEQILYLACGGVVVALQSLCYTLKVPPFNDITPPLPKKPTPLDELVAFLRESGRRTIWAFYLLRSLAVSFFIQLLFRNQALLDSYALLWSPAGLVILISLVIISAVIALSSTLARREAGSARLRWHLRTTGLFWAYFGGFVGAAMASHGVLVIFGQHLVFYFLAILEIAVLQNAPEDRPCPKLWSDPMAEYVWWLA